LATGSICSELDSHLGLGRDRLLRRPPRAARSLILLLPLQRNRLFHLTHLHQESTTHERYRQVPVAQSPHQVKGLPRRPLMGQGQGVLRHRSLDRLPHLRRRAEESVRRHQAPDPLMRAAKVVCLHEEANPPLAVVEVGKHRPRQKLLPQRLPEALDLAERLRMVRPALDVLDSLSPQLFFEFGLPTPRRVLPPLVRQHLPRRPVIRYRPRQRFHHQRRFLVVRHHERDQVARVVVHEGRHVDPLVASQQKRENVRLPELIRLRSLETRLLTPRLRHRRRRFLEQSFLVQNPTYRRLRHPKPLKPL
jgi:hypothetical protein